MIKKPNYRGGGDGGTALLRRVGRISPAAAHHGCSVSIGGSLDEKFHAYDKQTGALLWQHKLDAGGYATPCTYSVKGRQYAAIAAGGGGKLGTRSGDAFVAFA